MRWRRYGVALIPLAAGLVASLLFTQVAALPNPIVYVHVDAGTVALLAGLALSILVAMGLVPWEWARWRCAQREAGIRVQAAEERRRFLQRLDHELKNPLTAMRAGLANLANGLGPEAQGEALASVEAQVVRLSQLTADLRKLAELETRSLERVPVDIAELVAGSSGAGTGAARGCLQAVDAGAAASALACAGYPRRLGSAVPGDLQPPG